MRPGTTDRAAVEKRFGAALSAMPPPPKSFVVYFESGSDNFTEESKSTLAQMLEEMKQRPSPEITVIGHTDRVGSDQDNDTLSLQRAEKVQEMLVGMGVSSDHVNAAGRGSREPLVPTEAGVDEPRNRRVEVSVR
jgi:outer membrane protein OmpA-like peptidoglycan-associated protein